MRMKMNVILIDSKHVRYMCIEWKATKRKKENSMRKMMEIATIRYFWTKYNGKK